MVKTWILLVMLYNNQGPASFYHVPGFQDEAACASAANDLKLARNVDAFCTESSSESRRESWLQVLRRKFRSPSRN